jgi:hypothetical protein
MSSVIISGDTSGAITLAAPVVAGSNIITLPAATGIAVIGSSAVSAAGQIPFSTDGTSYTPTAKIVSGTAQASTSGTNIDFTGIPSWVKKITVMFQSVSISGSSNFLIQLGTSSGPITSGYISSAVGGGSATSTAGFIIAEDTNTQALIGQCIISQFSSSSWIASGLFTRSGSATLKTNAGQLTGSGTIDRVRITTSNGTDTFDAGSINILYE